MENVCVNCTVRREEVSLEWLCRFEFGVFYFIMVRENERFYPE